MQDTKGLINQITHHDKLAITLNENCKIAIPEDVLQQFLRPHRLSFYYFVFVYQGTSAYQVDANPTTLSAGQVLFGTPNQVFANLPKHKEEQSFKLGFDENTLALLPNTFPFLVNAFNYNTINFENFARERVKSVFANLFQLLHSPGKQQEVEIILAHLNTLLTELNSAYFKQHGQADTFTSAKLSKYIAFKLAVETHLTEQHDVHTIAQKLATTTSSLYSVVKAFSGVSPKEWMTNRLMQEAQRKLLYDNLSVKELAYELGFNDPDYFSRLFKKSTGKSISKFLADHHDLSSN